MPQMAPINWVTMFFLSILMFLIFVIMNYFSFSYKPKMIKKEKKNLYMNWKW